MTASTARPLPPKRLVPPMTAAPTAYSSALPPPEPGETLPVLAASRRPLTAAIVEQHMKAEVRMRTPDASGRRKFAGVLRGAQAGQVSMELEGQQIVQLALDDVDRAKLIAEL